MTEPTPHRDQSDRDISGRDGSAGLLLGADVGGTATRVALATPAGEVLALATGPAGNPNSTGLVLSAQRIRHTAARCLSLVGDPGPILAAVVGLAGGGRADETFLTSALPAGIGTPPRLVSDLAAAFGSATPAAEGYVLVAGTGAIAGHIQDGVVRERRDGWGWLLGDDGSGFWLGRAAVRATLAQLQAGLPPGQLGSAVLAQAEASDALGLIQRCYTRPPAWLASFGELVSRHADDPQAAAIAERAAEHLRRTLLALQPDKGLPVVLAGSVVTRPGPVRDGVLTRLGPAHPVLTAENGLVGALWLAALELGPADPSIHARLARSARRTTGAVV